MYWKWDVAGRTVRCDWNMWTGKMQAFVDGEAVVERKLFVGMRSKVFDLRLGLSREPSLTVKMAWACSPEAELRRDGVIVTPSEGLGPAPTWAWAFVSAAAIILIMGIGSNRSGSVGVAAAWGSFSGLLAALAAVAIAWSARQPRAWQVRAAACVTIVGVQWAATTWLPGLLT